MQIGLVWSVGLFYTRLVVRDMGPRGRLIGQEFIQEPLRVATDQPHQAEELAVRGWSSHMPDPIGGRIGDFSRGRW